MAPDPAPQSGGCLFIQFAREPVVGSVKTRMIPHLSPQQACDLHRELVLWTATTLVGARLGPVEMAVAGEEGDALFEACRGLGVAALVRQRGADLGERMYNALAAGLARFERVVLVGSDCPAIDAAYLGQALAALEGAEVVLGPAADGGYVLIGARRVSPAMFRGIAWGTAVVFAETTRRLDQLRLSRAELTPLVDIDRPADLPAWIALRDARKG